MPARDESDWSDSDSDVENPSDVETSVLLGVPDGPIEKEGELDDAAVSRLGGYPVRRSARASLERVLTCRSNKIFLLRYSNM